MDKVQVDNQALLTVRVPERSATLLAEARSLLEAELLLSLDAGRSGKQPDFRTDAHAAALADLIHALMRIAEMDPVSYARLV